MHKKLYTITESKDESQLKSAMMVDEFQGYKVEVEGATMVPLHDGSLFFKIESDDKVFAFRMTESVLSSLLNVAGRYAIDKLINETEEE